MATRSQPQPEDDGPPGPGPWIVTFSDCMTLLLCFFVMLVSFSSFDDVSYNRIAGSFSIERKPFAFIFQASRTIKDSVVPPRPRQRDHTQAGSEQPTDDLPHNIKNPLKRQEILSTDAYADRKVLRISSRRLFWGNGSSFSGDGQQFLHMVGRFMKLVPCYVIVAELPGPDERDLDPQVLTDRGLRRALAVMQYFTDGAGLPPERFHVAAGRGTAPGRFGGHPVIEITLLARNVYR